MRELIINYFRRNTGSPKSHRMNRIFAVVSFLTILILFSCTPKQDLTENKVPENIIQPDSMVVIIVDMQVAEAVLREMRRIGKYEENIAITSFEKVFTKHNISKKKYEESTAYYEQHLEIYENIYEKVITKLSQLQAEVKNPEGL